MPLFRSLDPDYEDSRAEDFRCPGCEVPTSRGRLCGACREYEDGERPSRPLKQ